MKILLTGAAGFCGMHVALRLLQRNDRVIGIDSRNDYYATSLKDARLTQLTPYTNFTFGGIDVCDQGRLNALFAAERFDRVVYLAAQPHLLHGSGYPV